MAIPPKEKKDEPFTKILDRDLSVAMTREAFGDQIDLLADMIDYGTKLVARAYAASPKDMSAAVAIPGLLKQSVLMADAYQVLLSNGCLKSADLQLRSLFEASIYLDFILSADFENRAKYYYVSTIRKDLLWCKRSLSDTQENKNFFSGLGEFSEVLESTREQMPQELVQEQIANIEKVLNGISLSEINQDFEKIYLKKGWEPDWYKPLGFNSLREISQEVDRMHEYLIIFSNTSETMHSSRYRDHFSLRSGKIYMEPIRHLENVNSSFNFTVSLLLHVYKQVVETYTPSGLKEFGNTYIERWREAFQAAPNIEYKKNPGHPNG